MKPLVGKVAVVAGGTRGCGRGIAAMLGEAGAVVYVTGRSTKGNRSDIGLVVEITDGVGYHYRGSFFYSLAKISVCHMAQALAEDLKPHGIAAVAVTPGFLRSEQMLDHFGVTESNWRDAAAQDPHYLQSETPYYIGMGVAALAADPNVMGKTGQMLSSWALSDEYGVTDVDGRRPHWGKYADEQGFYKHLTPVEQQLICYGPNTANE